MDIEGDVLADRIEIGRETRGERFTNVALYAAHLKQRTLG